MIWRSFKSILNSLYYNATDCNSILFGHGKTGKSALMCASGQNRHPASVCITVILLIHMFTYADSLRGQFCILPSYWTVLLSPTKDRIGSLFKGTVILDKLIEATEKHNSKQCLRSPWTQTKTYFANTITIVFLKALKGQGHFQDNIKMVSSF